MKRKKVLFITPLPPPHYGASMSSEMCLTILKGSKGIIVRNIKLNHSESMIDVSKVNYSKLKYFKKIRSEIKKALLEFKPDIVYMVPATTSYGLVRDFLLIQHIKKYYKNKILFHLRGRVTDKDWKNPIYRKLFKKMFKNERVIVLDKVLIRDLHNLVQEEDIYVLPNAIENEINNSDYNKIKRKYDKTLKLIFVSNMNKEKGWFKLLEACKLLNQEKIHFHCSFIGQWHNQKDRVEFENFIIANNLQEKVKYHGKKTGNERNELLKKSNILIFPTEFRLETFGRVVLEAMMFGLPVIASNIAAIPTTIKDKETGFILDENTPAQIAKNIKMFSESPRLIREMGEAGRKRFLKEYTTKTYKKRFLDIFNKL